jgi:hypothetical protein
MRAVTRRVVVLGILVLQAIVGAGCFGSSSNQSTPDGSPGFGYDAANAPAPEAGQTPRDATTNPTMPDATTPHPDAGVDAGTVDAATADVSDGAVDASADGPAGVVTTPSGLYLTAGRQNHTATLLTNGHVLICGGWAGASGSLATCDDFNPSTNTITAGPSMVAARRDQAATLLPGGQVLLVGGSGTTDGGAFGVLRNAEIYDPTSRSFALVSNPMAEARDGPALVLGVGSNAGKVLLVGGYGDGTVDGSTGTDTALDSAEVFDPGGSPVSGTFTLLAAHMSVRRGSLTAAGLPEGGLLAAGGSYGPGGGPYTYLSSGETLDPALSAFANASNGMNVGRQGAQSVTLPNGRIFVFDGRGAANGAALYGSARADIYDPATRTFTPTAALPAPRVFVALALLNSGRVMIAGGGGMNGALGDVVVYDPATDTFLPTTGSLAQPRTIATATTLNDGRVLIAGGQNQNGFISNAVDIFTE